MIYHPPEEPTEDVDEDDLEDPYSKGDYLNDTEYLILTPLEPSDGNYLINTSPRVLLRVLTSQAAIEFCCFFQDKIRISGMPVLQLSFPQIGRQIKGAREYRVKIPSGKDYQIKVIGKKDGSEFTTGPMDISMNGMCLYDPMGKKSQLQTDEKIRLQIIEDETLLISLNAVIRHVTRLRDAKGLQYVFGIQFDLATRALAAEVEQLVATIQRSRLRELSLLEDEYGVNLSDW